MTLNMGIGFEDRVAHTRPNQNLNTLNDYTSIFIAGVDPGMGRSGPGPNQAPYRSSQLDCLTLKE